MFYYIFIALNTYIIFRAKLLNYCFGSIVRRKNVTENVASAPEKVMEMFWIYFLNLK